ncbi:MAG: tRNA adenylyltransferase [Planctomycetaceae bacterium]|nr:tRNA adenylyltransferase [Planctomycetaceae bacterium]
MSVSRLRRQITWEAACLLYRRQESEYLRAKLKAARRVHKGWVKPADLPSNAEIRDEVQALARLYEGRQRTQNLQDMRLEALRMMRLLRPFKPRLIGSVLTGHVRQGSDIDLHLFSNSIEAVALVLQEEGCVLDLERKRVHQRGQTRVFTHLHVRGRFPFEMTIYAADQAHYVSKSSITGKPMERASIAELEQLLKQDYEGLELEQELADLNDQLDPYQVFEALLLPLENVQQSRQHHPEGDALYHSLQVFDLACDELPYDEEFLLAALLHDVGKGIDRADHVAVALDALQGLITDRTSWLIEYHMVAHQVLDGTIGKRAHRRLRESENYEELMLLARCDRDGRQTGVEASELEEALDYLRDLSETFGE